MDWMECELVERVEGKMGGRPVIQGTRIEPETIVVYAENGYTPEQILAEYPTLTVDTIRRVLAFAARRQPAA